MGLNGSMGFIKGKEYELAIVKQGNCLLVSEWVGRLFCPYGSFIAFLNNWDNIKIEPLME